jgi:hypothetical protein
MVAARVAIPPSIDGRDDDPAWHDAQPVTDFRVFSPAEGATPSFRTEVRAVYDDRALYVLVRAYDPKPDSIIGRLARRDTHGPPNDQVQLFLDSYHDRRNGYEYIVNPAGVKSDYMLFEDSGWDQSWDGIWDVATGVDSLGWVAEFRIPFQQLRFTDGSAPIFGFMVWRVVGRRGERVSWPQYRPSRAGLVSQAGTLTGIQGLRRTSGIEASPHALGRVHSGTGVDNGERWQPSFGGDLRFTPRPNINIAATFNPDFGQLAADPAVLNLSAFEVQQEERRLFFLEEAGPLNFPLAAGGSSLLFYSRRIGRRPVLADTYSSLSTETSILGATRVSARIASGVSVTALSALAAEELGPEGLAGTRPVIEPRAHYGVVSGQYAFRGGRSGFRLMATRVDRSRGDSATSALLPRIAQAGALSYRHESRNGDYQVSGWQALSDVRGSEESIAQLQLSSVHAFQRPDDGTEFDPSRASLQGSATYVAAGKVGGGVTRFGVSYRSVSPGFNVNDAGYQARADLRTISASAGLRASSPGVLLGVPYRSASITSEFSGDWSAEWLPHARSLSLTTTVQLPSQAELEGRVLAELSGAYCTIECTRGGPAIVDPPQQRVSVRLTGDTRRSLVPYVMLEKTRDDGGRSDLLFGEGGVTWRMRSNIEGSLALLATEAQYDWLFYRRFGDPQSDTTTYTVAALEGSTRSATARLNYTVTRDLSFQWYAQGYVSRGTYSNVRQLADTRSEDYSLRFRPYPIEDAGGLDFRVGRSNTVLRWEYRPGSTLFVVWSQVWQKSSSEPGRVRLGRDLRELFGLEPTSTLAVKVSYRVAR